MHPGKEDSALFHLLAQRRRPRVRTYTSTQRGGTEGGILFSPRAVNYGKLRQQRREKKRGLSVYHHQPLLYYVAWKEERGDLLFPPEEKGRKDSRTKGGRRKEIMKDTQGEETEETEVKKWATFCSGAPRNRLLHFAQLHVFCSAPQ